MREFAVQRLALPDNDTYRSYSDLRRPFAVWNVFAAPPLSLEGKQWCFPVVGCVSYRGYFEQAQAESLGKSLREAGWDVFVAGIPAYSTLGWFDDPVLNTFAFWPSGRLADLLFHELSHQQLYIADDTTFNESFATTVGRSGARLWLERYGTAEELAEYRAFLERYDQFLELVLPVRDRLAEVYASDLDDTVKLQAKGAIFQQLRADYARLRDSWEGYIAFDYWFSQDLNNAKFAALGAYNQWVPAFRILLQQSEHDFTAFYQAVEALGSLLPQEREARLRQLLAAQRRAPLR